MHLFFRLASVLESVIGPFLLYPFVISWFEIIDECGNYDQSQHVHDFTQYSNISPTISQISTRYLRDRIYRLIIFLQPTKCFS
jgi:hypothetical protein